MAHRQDVEKAGKMAVLTKADAVVGLLMRFEQLTPGEIADQLGEPRSSIYRLLSSLEDLGWVERDSRPHGYRLGLKLIGIGAATARHLDVRRVAMPIIEQLGEISGESIFLCVRREWRAVCIERIEGTGVQSLVLQVGGSLPLHSSAAGLALLAFEPLGMWDDYLAAGGLTDYPDPAPVDASGLFRLLDESRRSGVVVSDEGTAAGMAGIGAPIFDHRRAVVAALAVSGLRTRVLSPALGLVEMVAVAGAEVSAGLGFAAEPVTAS